MAIKACAALSLAPGGPFELFPPIPVEQQPMALQLTSGRLSGGDFQSRLKDTHKSLSTLSIPISTLMKHK